MKARQSLGTVLRGMSQVFLQNNELAGFLLLLGIFYNSWIMGLGALLGVCTGTLTAHILNYDAKDLRNGLYGFNGALVGIALIALFQVSAMLVGLVIAGAAFSSVIMNFMHERKLAPYTFPFVLSAWIMIVLANAVMFIPASGGSLLMEPLEVISSVGMGIGQVMFQANIVTGAMFLLALLVCSRITALYAFVGSATGAAIALALSFPIGMINAGLFGFNGVLCGIAFSGKRWRSLVYALVAVSLSVLIFYWMEMQDVVPLTAPFVFSTWLVLLLRKRIEK